MAQTHSIAYCPRCGRDSNTIRKKADHMLHLVLFLLCCGVLWAPIWAVAALDPGPEKCTSCGTTVSGGNGVILYSILAVGYVVLASWIGLQILITRV